MALAVFVLVWNLFFDKTFCIFTVVFYAIYFCCFFTSILIIHSDNDVDVVVVVVVAVVAFIGELVTN